MLKQAILYTNFNDEKVKEDFYFNFTMLEMIEQVEIHNVNDKLEQLTNTNDGPGAYLLFKGIVLDSYGVKSADGRVFEKSPALRHQFENSAAISELIIGFLKDANAGIEFIRGVLPKEMLDQATIAVEAKRAQEAAAKVQTPGIHESLVAQSPGPEAATYRAPAPVAPTVEETGETAAFQRGERQEMQPLDTGVEMSTSEKRMYTADELEAINGVPGTVPVPDGTSTKQFTDEEVLAMSPQELNARGLLMRAYALKTSGAPVTDS